MMRKCWAVKVHKLADSEMRELGKLDPCGLEEVIEVMTVLAHEPEPRWPNNPRLNVCVVAGTNQEWYRVRSLRGQYRVVFRVLQRRGENFVEIRTFDKLVSDATEQVLQVVRAGHRFTVYDCLRQLRDKVKGVA